MANRAFLPFLALVAASWMLQGCAGTPKAEGPGGATASAPAPASAASRQESGDALAPDVAEAAKGYDRVVKNGERFFCRRERPIGSKMYTTVCLSEAQLREQVVNNKKFQEGTMGQGRRCSSGPGCQN